MTSKRNRRSPPLGSLIEEALTDYLDTLDGHKPCDLYKMVIGETEQALLRVVMAHVEGNQSRAAELLSINRGTLRKKLKLCGIKTS